MTDLETANGIVAGRREIAEETGIYDSTEEMTAYAIEIWPLWRKILSGMPRTGALQ